MNELNIDTEIVRLAALTRLEYHRQRKKTAKDLNIPLSILDDEVKQARSQLQNSLGQGQEISLLEPEPWEEPVDGNALLEGLVKVIRAYVVMNEQATIATALWAIHSYAHDASTNTPRLAVLSPEKGCGKTTLLDVLGQIVNRPLLTANVTPAVVFRMIELATPTLLVDEADSFLKGNEELRGILNSGHRKGGQVIRTVGDKHEPRGFSTCCPLAIALIGKLPDTLQDRSVVISLRRRLQDEVITQFRADRTDELKQLARKIRRWTDDNRGALIGAEPDMPPALFNRVADNWRPLLAIADAVGGEWPEKARKAAIELSARNDTTSFRTLLLTDIKTVFEVCNADKVSSQEIADKLAAMEGHPWAELSRGRPITTNALARLLKPFGIIPSMIRIGSNTIRGYTRDQFADAWGRYLSSDTLNQTATMQQWPEFQSLADDFKDLPDEDCGSVAVQKSSPYDNAEYRP